MIDQFALALGHGLLAAALLRLALRDDVDADPLVAELGEAGAARRRAASPTGRKAARRAGRAVPGREGIGAQSGGQAAHAGEGDPALKQRSDSAGKPAQAAKRRAGDRAQAAKR
ncbi:MAG: hypothetical protein RIB52_10020 [Erythrobacter sp.]|uniref:hypothetical protein n=1 Tax=Erythrobacter sp. TaxID=1042 RepID=UPI0032ECEECD